MIKLKENEKVTPAIKFPLNFNNFNVMRPGMSVICRNERRRRRNMWPLCIRCQEAICSFELWMMQMTCLFFGHDIAMPSMHIDIAGSLS